MADEDFEAMMRAVNEGEEALFDAEEERRSEEARKAEEAAEEARKEEERKEQECQVAREATAAEEQADPAPQGNGIHEDDLPNGNGDAHNGATEGDEVSELAKAAAEGVAEGLVVDATTPQPTEPTTVAAVEEVESVVAQTTGEVPTAVEVEVEQGVDDAAREALVVSAELPSGESAELSESTAFGDAAADDVDAVADGSPSRHKREREISDEVASGSEEQAHKRARVYE